MWLFVVKVVICVMALYVGLMVVEVYTGKVNNINMRIRHGNEIEQEELYIGEIEGFELKKGLITTIVVLDMVDGNAYTATRYDSRIKKGDTNKLYRITKRYVKSGLVEDIGYEIELNEEDYKNFNRQYVRQEGREPLKEIGN